MARPHRPKGAWSDKAWRDAIRLAVLRAADDPKQGKKLHQLADALVSAGCEGDVPALKEIGDRLDGKVPQALIGGGEDDPAVRIITKIERVIVRPSNPNR